MCVCCPSFFVEVFVTQLPMTSQDVCSNFARLGKMVDTIDAIPASVGVSDEQTTAIKIAFASAAPWPNYHSMLAMMLQPLLHPS